MALRDTLSPEESDILQTIMLHEPFAVNKVPANRLIPLTALCHRGLVKYSKRGWIINWTHVPRPS